MCGICGFLAHDGLAPGSLRKMNDVIWRRGPDGEGFLETGPVGLAMRRLAIIDIAGGWQPVYNEDRSVAVVFNGEIYNFERLREGLIARGHQLRTRSDTEVIVHLYEEHGADLVSHLEGMFTFALWDTRKQTLLLARDRLGIKPLFLARLPQGLLFGSEIKSLMATGLVPTDIDYAALDSFLSYTYIPAPRTIYRAIEKVPPGHVVLVEPDGRVQMRSYWQVPDAAIVERTESEWMERVENGLRSAVASHLVSDVPVGAFLSGGIDSGLMVAMMAQALDKPVETFTVGFRDAGTSFIDERGYARQIAERYRLNHHEIDVEPKVEEILPQIAEAFDEPFADDSVVPSYYVCKVAAQHVKVAMTGLGGDELFAGYKRHLGIRLGDLYRRVPSLLREGLVAPIVRRIPEPRNSNDLVDHLKRFSRTSSALPAERYEDSLTTLPAAERMRLYAPDVARQMGIAGPAYAQAFDGFDHGGSVDRALKSDLALYLPDDILTLTDRLSMWHSLELRVPFLDHRFVEDIMTMPASLKIKGTNQKHILKKVAAKFLPEGVITHRKQGFEAPMGRWLRGPLRGLLQDRLSPAALRRGGIFDSAAIQRLIDEHVSGKRKHSKILFSLLMFQLWSEQAGSSAASAEPSATRLPLTAAV